MDETLRIEDWASKAPREVAEYVVKLKADLARLTEENTRYREALDRIGILSDLTEDKSLSLFQIGDIARAALVKGEA